MVIRQRKIRYLLVDNWILENSLPSNAMIYMAYMHGGGGWDQPLDDGAISEVSPRKKLT